MMFDWKTMLLLSFLALILVTTLSHREMMEAEGPMRAGYSLLGLDF